MDPKTTLQSRLDALDAEDAAAHDATRPVTLDQQSTGRLTRMDALQNQAMAQAQVRRRAAERLRIQAALARLAEGEYGFCTDCGEAVEPARLAADPSMPKCRDCMQAG
jgi:RNA polymerase-binding transcription factor